jgi:hypothetical protein
MMHGFCKDSNNNPTLQNVSQHILSEEKLFAQKKQHRNWEITKLFVYLQYPN